MLLSTPVEGTHYLVDPIIGIAVALAAMRIVDAMLARRVVAARRAACGYALSAA
jgi:hypothetical protein